MSPVHIHQPGAREERHSTVIVEPLHMHKPVRAEVYLHGLGGMLILPYTLSWH